MMPTGNRYSLEREMTLALHVALDAQSAALLVRTVAEFPPAVSVSYRGREADARSIMGLLSLGAAHGATLRVRVDGEREAEVAAAMRAIEMLVARDFEESS